MSSNIMLTTNKTMTTKTNIKQTHSSPSYESHASSELCGVLQRLHVVVGQQVRVLETNDLVVDADLINNSRCLTYFIKLDNKTN